MDMLTFTWRSLPTHTDLWLLSDVFITSECTELWSISLSELPPSEEGQPLEELPGILGALCFWHHLLCPTMCWVWELTVLLTSPSDTPSSRPYTQSSTLQAPAEDQMALLNPWGHLKAYQSFLQEPKYNNVLGWQSQCPTSGQACPQTINRLILPKHRWCPHRVKITFPKDVFLTATLGRSAVLHSHQFYTENQGQETSTVVFQ